MPELPREPPSSTDAGDVDSETVDVRDSPRVAAAVPSVGEAIGRYVVLDVLGSGGMGTVLRAYDPKLHREVALKRLRSSTMSPEHGKRLVREAQALAQLSHPNVVAVYDVEWVAGEVIVAMELVRGPSLDHWLRALHPWRERVELLLQAGRGLAAAHRSNLVHRDFKPSNVMITPEGSAKVTDFGLAKPAASEESSEADLARERARAHLSAAQALEEPFVVMTRVDEVMGTPAYMAPEQQAGASPDPAADQFAFCVTLWQALTGVRPFQGDVTELAHGKHLGPPPWPSHVTVPQRLVAAVRRGLAPAPYDRWPTMDALLEALAASIRPRRSRFRGLGLTGVLGGSLLAVVSLQSRLAERCGGAEEQLAAIWDDETRTRVQQGIEAASVVAAEPVWDRVSERLDGYAAAWVEQHRAACEATNVRGEQSTAVLDLRMACLQRARAELRASVELLSGVDERTVLRAVELVRQLPELERCEDVDALLAEAPPPEDPVARAGVEDARDRLAEARSLHRLGRYDEALVAVRLVEDAAERLEHPPLTAEVGALEGLVLEALGRFEHAEPVLRRSALLAVEVGAVSVAVRALATWSFVLAERLGRNDEGMLVAELELRLARRTARPALEAEALGRLASVLHNLGDFAAAESRYREALSILGDGGMEDELGLATILNDLGGLLQERGRGEEALAAHRHALEIRERLLGPEHPYVGSSLTNLGNVYFLLRQPEAARASVERALAIFERAYDEDHALTTVTRGNLGALLIQRGELDRAAPMLERVAQARARIYGESHVETGAAYSNLGALEQARGRPERAREHLQRALDSWIAALGPDHPQLRSLYYSLGLVEQDLGHRERAIASLERALALDDDASDEQRGNITLALAASLWDDPATRKRARHEAERALAAYERAPHANEERAKARAWLAEHPLPP